MATTSTSLISKNPKVCGRVACIAGTRIRVMDIVCLEREGYPPERMLDVFATRLTLPQVQAALAYYQEHREEIEAEFAEEQALVAEGERLREEYLKRLSSK